MSVQHPIAQCEAAFMDPSIRLTEVTRFCLSCLQFSELLRASDHIWS